MFKISLKISLSEIVLLFFLTEIFLSKLKFLMGFCQVLKLYKNFKKL